MSFINMFIDIHDENNDPYYHENLNNDNIDHNANNENTYDNNTNIYDNNYLDNYITNFNGTLRDFISYITNNTFMFNNSTTMTIDDYINEEDDIQTNNTHEISSSSEDEQV